MRNLDIKTKYFDQDSYQLPKLTNTWGCMVDTLDVVLVLGTPKQDVLGISVTEDLKFPEKYWIATFKLNVDHGFKDNLSVIEVTGCIVEDFNQVFRVQETTPTSVTVAFSKQDYPNIPTAVPGTLGVSIHTPALGYEKAFEGPQKAAYKVTTKEGFTSFLRVDASCPPGHNPAYAKFSRVSMLSEMKHIDDYSYIRGRKKAPADPNDYDRVERDIYIAWFNIKSLNGTGNYILNTSFVELPVYMFFGDSETFMIHIPECRYSSTSSLEDVMYIFGKYTKYIYKEDPLPFILKAAQRESLTGGHFDNYNLYPNITRDRPWGKYTFSTKDEGLLEVDSHEEFGLHLSDTQLSGCDTRINFIPYKNEISINLAPFELRFFRPGNTILEGRYRGIYSIIGNIQNNPHLAPKFFEIFENTNKHFIRLPSRHQGGQGPEASLTILLNDWE